MHRTDISKGVGRGPRPRAQLRGERRARAPQPAGVAAGAGGRQPPARSDRGGPRGPRGRARPAVGAGRGPAGARAAGRRGASCPPPDPPAEPAVVLPGFATATETPAVPGDGRALADGTVPMTRLELERVVGNLVDNARRHARSRVELGFRDGARGVVSRRRRRRRDPGGRPGPGLRPVRPPRRRPRPRHRRQRAGARDRPRAGPPPRRRHPPRRLVVRRPPRRGPLPGEWVVRLEAVLEQPSGGRPARARTGELLDAVDAGGCRAVPRRRWRRRRAPVRRPAARRSRRARRPAAGSRRGRSRTAPRRPRRAAAAWTALPGDPARLLAGRREQRLAAGRLDHLRDPVAGRERRVGPLQEHHPRPRPRPPSPGVRRRGAAAGRRRAARPRPRGRSPGPA